MKYLAISLLMLYSVTSQAITTTLVVIKPVPVCIANGKYFYVNFYGDIYLVPYVTDNVVGECDAEE